jgi:hypothetical protein
MNVSSERPLKVLTPEFANSLRVFNSAARQLQQTMGFRLHRIDPVGNLLVVAPDDGRRLVRERLTEGFRSYPTAGSTRYTVIFNGVIVEWREPISHTSNDSL